MEQVLNYADNRLINENACIYCGAICEKRDRDHVPSRILLDSPFPKNVPVVNACRTCNGGFSKDEEYVACLIESAIAGSTDPGKIRRSKVANILHRAPALRARLEAAKVVSPGGVRFNVESDRVRNVVLKLARGHAAFELAMICRGEPSFYWWRCMGELTKEVLNAFNERHIATLLGEIGSRGSQRTKVIEVKLKALDGSGEKVMRTLVNDWLIVQENNYRYITIHGDGYIEVKFAIAEFLACVVRWDI
jgi:hypothetical protein